MSDLLSYRAMAGQIVPSDSCGKWSSKRTSSGEGPANTRRKAEKETAKHRGTLCMEPRHET